MNTIAFILMLVAAVLFALEGVFYYRTDSAGRRPSTMALGLCALTVGLIVEFAAKTHSFHF